MRHKLLLLVCILTAAGSTGHAQDQGGGNYGGLYTSLKLVRGTTIYFRQSGGTEDSLRLYSTLKFSFADEHNGRIIINFNEITQEAENFDKTDENKFLNKSNQNLHQYYLKTGIGKSFRYKYQRIDLYPVAIPIKARLNIGDARPGFQAESPFNLAGFLGYQWGTANYSFRRERTSSITLGAFAGPSQIIFANGGTTESKLGATAGFGIEIDPGTTGLQVGLFAGWDWLDSSVQWNYQGKMWLGFGIGYSFRRSPTEQ